MEDLKEEMQTVLSGSPAVVEQTAQTANIPQQDVLPATNIKTFSPTTVEQINPDDDSGLIDFSTGYESDGQANLAGVAGARRPISGERGDPFFLDPVERYKEVAPFDLYLPSLGKYAKLNTTQPDKAGWQLLRAEGKLPEYDYMGYYRMREAPTENGVMAFIKGVPATVSKLGLAMVRGVTSYPYEMGLQDSYAARQPAVKPAPDDAGAMWNYLSKNAAADGMISPQAKKINDWWNETYSRIDDIYGVGTYENPSLGAEIGSGVASGLASIGMLYLAPLPGAVSMALMNFGMSSPRIYYDAMNAGVSPSGAKTRALAGGAAITALDSLSLIGSSVMRGVRRAAVGEVLQNNGFGKTLWRVTKRAPIEMGTEMAQGAIEDWLAMSLQTPEEWEASLDARALEALTAGMSFVASSIPEYHNLTKQQRADKIAEFVKNGGGVKVYNQMAKMLAPAIKDGILNKSDVAKLTGLALDHNNIDFVSDRMQTALLGAMDKATPEQVNALLEKVRKLKDSGAELSAEAFDKLDALVAKRVKEGGFADADVPLYQGLFRGLAAIKAYAKGEMLTDADIGRFFSMEKIGPSDKTLGTYNKKTDTTVIKRAPQGGKSDFDVYIRRGFQPDSSLTERVKTILHEFSHKIDAIVGKPGAAQFMADYIEAVSEVFSAEHAKAVAEGAKGKPKGGTKYTQYSDASEWKAQAIERLGRAAQKYLGLNGSKAREFVSFANMMINGVKSAGLADKAVAEYQKAMEEQIKANGDRWAEVMDYYGQKELSNKIRAFLGDSSATAESVGISGDDMAKIVRVLKGYLDDLGIAKVESVMSLDDVEPFIEKADRLFAEGVESANKESERLLGKGEKTQSATEKTLNSAEAFFDREEFLTDDELQSRRVEGYHSSPDSQFDNPSTSAIGSGEGGAAHGWGIYFLADKSLDKLKYWSNLAMRKGVMPIDAVVELSDGTTKTIPVSDVGQDLLLELGRFNMYGPEDILWFDGRDILEPDSSLISAESDAEGSLWESFLSATTRQAGIDDANVKQISLSVDKTRDFGQIQKALLPDDSELLYENITLSAHPESVRSALKKTAEATGVDYKSEYTGRGFYNRLVSATGSKEAASKALLANGIKGIEYVGKRDGKGWVIFDEDAIDIIDTVRGTENIVQYSSKDPLEQYGLMPATAQKNEAVKAKKQTFGDWYAENNVDTVIKDTESAIEKQSSLRTRFPKFAKFWGKMTAGNVMSTLDWLGGKELVEQFDLVNAERVWNNERFAIQEATQTKAMKEMGKNAIQMEAFYNDMARGRVKITEADGKVRVLNGFEMMDVLLNDEQPFAKERGALAFQDGQAGVDAVIAAMTPEMKQYAHLMRDKIAELREEYQKTLGKRFRDWENYWPVTDARGQLLSKNRVFSDYSRDTGAKGKLQIRDAREKFNMYVNRVALAKSGYYKQLTLLRSMIAGVPERFSEISGDEVALAARLEEGNIKINTMIQDALGEDGVMKFLEAIDTLLRSPTQDIVSFNKGVLGKAVANARISRLVWAPISWAKNATNIFLQANADPDGSASYWKGMANALSNPKEAWNFMMQFPSIRNRLKGITVDEFLQATNVSPSMLNDLANMINNGNSTPSKAMAQLAAIAKMANRTGQSFMLLGDAFGNVFGLYGYASKLMTKYNGDIDMVDRALHDHIVHTQSSTLRSVKSSFHRKLLALPIVGGLASFTGDPVQKFNTMAHNIAQAIVGEKTFGEASRAVLPIVMSTIAFIMASVGIGDLWDDNEENDAEVYNALNNELISQALGFTPLSNVLAPAVKKLFGMQDAGMNTPFTSMMNDTAAAINKGKWEDVALNAATMFGGIYVDRFANSVDGFGDVLFGDTPEDREIGARRAIGRTKRFAEKRVRPTKKKVDNKQ